MINPQNKQQVFDILTDKKLTDKTFMSIRDLIMVTKVDDVGTWLIKFWKICWLLRYPCEYWDYFFKRSITKYKYENHLKQYRNTYKEDKQRLIDIYNTKGELKESENILKCEYINAKKIIKEWIEKQQLKYFSNLDKVVKVFGQVSIADLFYN